MIRTACDTGVLIALARGKADQSATAERLLADPERLFVGSKALALELLPKAVYHQRQGEADLYRAYLFGLVTVQVDLDLDLALDVAQRFGLSAMEALHVAAAITGQCDELVTTEAPDRPPYRINGHVGRLVVRHLV
jgi:predicted nucleic acid-binding protein